MMGPKYSLGVIIVAVTMGSEDEAIMAGSGHCDGAVTSSFSPFVVTTGGCGCGKVSKIEEITELVR
jgi:hypothetical protein